MPILIHVGICKFNIQRHIIKFTNLTLIRKEQLKLKIGNFQRKLYTRSCTKKRLLNLTLTRNSNISRLMRRNVPALQSGWNKKNAELCKIKSNPKISLRKDSLSKNWQVDTWHPAAFVDRVNTRQLLLFYGAVSC